MKTARELAEAVVEHLESTLCHPSRSIALMQLELLIGKYQPGGEATDSLKRQLGKLRTDNQVLESHNRQLESLLHANDDAIEELKSELKELRSRKHLLALSHP